MRICQSFTNLIKWRERRVTSSGWLAISISAFYMINICFWSSSLKRYSSLKFSFSTFTVTMFLKIITMNFFFTVNNSRQFCTKYFAVKSVSVQWNPVALRISSRFNQFLNNKICSFLIWKRCWFTKSRWVYAYVVESRTSWNGHPSLSCFHSLAFSHM